MTQVNVADLGNLAANFGQTGGELWINGDFDYNGNVNVRLAGVGGPVMTVVAHRANHEERRPDDFHRQLVRVVAELSDAAGTFLVRPVHDEMRGWQWVTESL